MKTRICSFVWGAAWLFLFAASAQGAEYDLSGEWSYTTSNQWKKGVCPAGKPATGTCRIVQEGDAFTLEIMDGMVCDPASMCSYSGTVDGATYTCSSSDTVDDEGGVATNTIVFTASSLTEASGQDTSEYVLNDFSCQWGFDISFTRDEERIPGDVTEDPEDGDDAGAEDGDDDALDGAGDEEEDSGCRVAGPGRRSSGSLLALAAGLL